MPPSACVDTCRFVAASPGDATSAFTLLPTPQPRVGPGERGYSFVCAYRRRRARRPHPALSPRGDLVQFEVLRLDARGSHPRRTCGARRVPSALGGAIERGHELADEKKVRQVIGLHLDVEPIDGGCICEGHDTRVVAEDVEAGVGDGGGENGGGGAHVIQARQIAVDVDHLAPGWRGDSASMEARASTARSEGRFRRKIRAAPFFAHVMAATRPVPVVVPVMATCLPRIEGRRASNASKSLVRTFAGSVYHVRPDELKMPPIVFDEKRSVMVVVSVEVARARDGRVAMRRG